MQDDLPMWEPKQTALVPLAAATGEEIVQYAKQLSRRDVLQIRTALAAGSHEMATTFVWTKTMTALKKQLEALGMDFIAEMLGRSDIGLDSSIEHMVTDYEAIRLAEDLGVLSTTNALRLRHFLELIIHFSQRDELEDTEEMSKEEALVCLRACIQGVLGHPSADVAIRFVEFRQQLETKVFNTSDEQMLSLQAAPYFFQKTTLSALLTLVRKAEGAQLENALGNMNTILPLLWPKLRKPEKWQTGHTYAEIHAEGRSIAVSGLRKALTRVKGFDFVPENLRSETFKLAAQKVQEAHDSFNNYHNEPAPMMRLALLGSAIPMPAFLQCMRATLCVRLGNSYGISYAAQDSALTLLNSVSRDRWEYFLSECLPTDRRILDKLLDAKPRQRWMDLVHEFDLSSVPTHDKKVEKLVTASMARSGTAVELASKELIKSMGYADAPT